MQQTITSTRTIQHFIGIVFMNSDHNPPCMVCSLYDTILLGNTGTKSNKAKGRERKQDSYTSHSISRLNDLCLIKNKAW